MSALTRNDGTQFVIQAYRERLTFKKKASLAQKVRNISAQQGQFVRLLKRRNGEYETIFSENPGYLVGESIKNYFPKMKNLLFIEAWPETENFLFVVIRNGHVFIDSLMTREDLSRELLPLTTLNIAFQVILSGRLPDEIINLDSGFLPKKIVDTVEHLREPLLQKLPTPENVRLIPLPLALRNERLDNNTLFTTGAIITLFIAVVASGFIYLKHQQKKPAVIVNSQPVAYEQYHRALDSPAPDELLGELVNVIETSWLIPGWRATGISQTPNRYELNVSTIDGSLTQLQHWAEKNHYQLFITSRGALLRRKTDIAKRQYKQPAQSLETIAANLIDETKKIAANPVITVKSVIQHRDARELPLAIDLDEIDPQQLVYLSQILVKMPVTLRKAQLAIRTSALLDSQIQLSVWGR